MGTTSLDEFVQRIQTAAGYAQDAVTRGQRARVARDLQLNGSSDVEGETWCLKVELTPPGGGPSRTVSIPFASLHTLTETKVTQLRVETTATVESVPAVDDPTRQELQLRIGPPRSRRDRLHKLVVEVFGVNLERAEVRLNDRLLRIFGFPPRRPAEPPAKQAGGQR